MRRIQWQELPADVREHVLMGLEDEPDEVEAVRFPHGGFTSGLVCIIDTSGGSYFVKAMHESSPEASLELLRDELLVLSRTTQSYPIPSFVHTVEHSGWLVLVTKAVAGLPLDQRTDEAGLIAALDALVVLQEQTMQQGRLPHLTERYEGLFDHVPDLRAEQAVAAASAGDQLVHGDLRTDNVLMGDDGRAWLVDWAWGCRGHVWADAVTLMCSARDVPPERRWALLTDHPVREHASTENLHGYIDAIAAMYDWASQRPAPPGVPGLRPWQRQQARHAMDLSLAAARNDE